MKKNFIFILLIFTAFSVFFIRINNVYAENLSPNDEKTKAAKDLNDFKEILINPYDEVKQGQTVFIKIKVSKELKNPVFKFKGKKYKIFKTNKNEDSEAFSSDKTISDVKQQQSFQRLHKSCEAGVKKRKRFSFRFATHSGKGDDYHQNEYSGLLGIDVLEKTGEYKILLSDESGILNDKAFIKVILRDYPVQNIMLTEKMSGITASKHELKQIGKAKYTLTDKLLRTNLPYNSPTEGCINSVFGLKRHYNGKFSGNYHKGVDIKAPEGEPVRAITNGTVIIAEEFRLHGGTVTVDHGQGLISLYIHLSKIDVNVGDSVTTGQKIGEVGETGFATGPHLHWGLYVNGTSVDPMADWIKPINICN